jgi:CRP-like cAMP-binding protein
VIVGQLAALVPVVAGEVRLELVTPGQLIVLQEMLSGGLSPVRVVADQDADVLAIPARALVDAMDSSPVIARDISVGTEARRQAAARSYLSPGLKDRVPADRCVDRLLLDSYSSNERATPLFHRHGAPGDVQMYL